MILQALNDLATDKRFYGTFESRYINEMVELASKIERFQDSNKNAQELRATQEEFERPLDNMELGIKGIEPDEVETLFQGTAKEFLQAMRQSLLEKFFQNQDRGVIVALKHRPPNYDGDASQIFQQGSVTF